mgnify:CR=1 FL=1
MPKSRATSSPVWLSSSPRSATSLRDKDLRAEVVTPEDENGNLVSVLGKAASSHKRSVVVASPPQVFRSLPNIDHDGEEQLDHTDDDDQDQEGEDYSDEEHLAIPHSLFRRLSTTSHMSLPRSNYDPRRVCLNPFPNLTLGKHKRAIGVYIAGALVCDTSASPLATCSQRW